MGGNLPLLRRLCPVCCPQSIKVLARIALRGIICALVSGWIPPSSRYNYGNATRSLKYVGKTSLLDRLCGYSRRVRGDVNKHTARQQTARSPFSGGRISPGCRQNHGGNRTGLGRNTSYWILGAALAAVCRISARALLSYTHLVVRSRAARAERYIGLGTICRLRALGGIWRGVVIGNPGKHS
jgi:hypothetical protein